MAASSTLRWTKASFQEGNLVVVRRERKSVMSADCGLMLTVAATA